MAESTTLEIDGIPIGLADSEAAPPAPSDERTPAVPAETGDESRAAPEEEKPAAQDQVTPPATETTTPAPSADEDYRTLRTRYDAWRADPETGDPLTTEEKVRLSRFERSIEDRQRAETQARDLARQNRESLAKLGVELPDRLLSAVNAEMATAAEEGRNPHPSLLKAALTEEAQAFVREAEPFVVLAYDARVRSVNYELAKQLHDEATAQAVTDPTHSYVEQVDYYGQLNYQKGYQEGLAASGDAKKLTALEQRATKAEAELSKQKDDRGKGNGASTNGRNATSGLLTPETYKERLEAGTPVSSEEIDAMTRAYADA